MLHGKIASWPRWGFDVEFVTGRPTLATNQPALGPLDTLKQRLLFPRIWALVGDHKNLPSRASMIHTGHGPMAQPITRQLGPVFHHRLAPDPLPHPRSAFK